MRKHHLFAILALACALPVSDLAAGGASWVKSFQSGIQSMSIPEMAQQMFSQSEVAALATAAATGQVTEVHRLLDAGVNVNSKGTSGFTPLGYSLVRGNLEGAEALLKRGADPNFGLEDAKFKAPYPFILVICERGSGEALTLLLRYGGNANAREPVRSKAKADQQYEGESLLTSPTTVTDFGKVKALVQYGADVNYVTHPDLPSGGATAAVVAARLGQLEVVDYLLERGASDFDQIAHSLQSRGWSDDQKALRLAILRKLLDKGGRIYPAYRPRLSQDVEKYPPQDIPADWITPGYLDMRQVAENRLQRWMAQQRNATK